jgi:hypothetical protein
MKRQLTIAAIGLLSLGATLATAAPASADIGWIKTLDGAPGGEAKFVANGDKLTVCDIEADGWAAQATLYGYGLGQLYVTALSNGSCVTKAFSTQVPEGLMVYIRVCLVKTGSAGYCRTSNTSTS